MENGRKAGQRDKMGKRTALLFSVLLLAGLLFWGTRDREAQSAPGVLTPGALSGEARQAGALFHRLPETLDAEEVRLCFRGEELACDRETGTWYLPVDMDSESWEKGTFTAFGEDIQVLPLIDYTILDKKTLVSEGERVPFLAWKEEEAVCTRVHVVFTGLPVVRMETDADLDIDTVFAGNMVVYDACKEQDWVMHSGFAAHERGQTTRAFPKKGYRVELISVTGTGVVNENPKSILKMRTSDSWIFYAIYSDGTKVRDKFNIELWNAFGAGQTPYDAHFGTHMEYAELIVNGEYRGLYGILEPVDCTQLSISGQEYLYKRTRGRTLSTDLLDTAMPEEYPTLLGVEIKGKEGNGSREDWQCFRSFVSIGEAEDAEFAQKAENLLNMKNAADMWLYLQMIYGEDNIYKNMFFAFKKESGGRRLYFVPWDVDLTWGNVYTDEKEDLYTVFAGERAEEYLKWPFMDRVIELDVGGMQSVITERWSELRETVLSEEHMETVLDACIHQVQDSGAFMRDASRWSDSHHDGDYDRMRDFIEKRMIYLDKNIKNMDEWLQD